MMTPGLGFTRKEGERKDRLFEGRSDCSRIIFKGAVAIDVGIDFGAISRVMKLPHHAARSTLWIEGLFGKALPAVDFAHGDLA